jgi:Ca2+-transporting ATPase
VNETTLDAPDATCGASSRLPQPDSRHWTFNTPDPNQSFADRKRFFGENRLHAEESKPFWWLMRDQFNDKILCLLALAAVISLALSLFTSTQKQGTSEDPLIEAIAFSVAFLVVVVVGGLNDWLKERQFVRLNARVLTA